jgi:polysaccharide deacetylase 2 family uncharacterized protein YibQ
VLLAAIGGLLAVLVTLLPEVPGGPGEDDTTAVAADGPGEEPGSVSVEGAPEEAAPGAAGGADAPATAAEGGPAAVTETYPEEESLPASETADESQGDLWWLPAVPEGTTPGRLYLILDDAGNALDPLPEFLRLPVPLAVAVLPQLPYSVESAARSAAAGKEIMLHQPMEALGGANPGPGVITASMSDSEVLRTIDENLATVPGATGVNNHMGSLGTSDERLMEIVLADVKRRGLFFVDSRTTVDSVAEPVAERLGTPFAARQVFLDNVRTRDAILESIQRALLLSHTQDAVVMIGHATVEELAAVLTEISPLLLENGYSFGAISDLMAAPRLAGRETP